jgi:Uma2 family endonuclease
MSAELLRDAPLTPHSGLGPYRRRDYEELPEQPRCELLFGRLYVTPAPTLWHQVVVQHLWRLLERIAESSGGHAFLAPVDVVLADHSVVQPDVVYVSARHVHVIHRRQCIEGPPDLLVEVVSPGTARRDRSEKLRLYAQAGIREYWIFDPEARQTELLVNEAGQFVVALPVAGRYQSQSLPEVHLDLAEFWRKIELRLPPE